MARNRLVLELDADQPAGDTLGLLLEQRLGLRSLDRSVFGEVTSVPFTRMRPFWTASSPFTVLMSVDFPEPEGPHTTTTSPRATRHVQSLRTWKAPYHLEMWSMSIMGEESSAG